MAKKKFNQNLTAGLDKIKANLAPKNTKEAAQAINRSVSKANKNIQTNQAKSVVQNLERGKSKAYAKAHPNVKYEAQVKFEKGIDKATKKFKSKGTSKERQAPVMATDKYKNADADWRERNPLTHLKRHAEKSGTWQADNYTRKEMDARLEPGLRSSLKKAEATRKKELYNSEGGPKYLISAADKKNFSDEEKDNLQYNKNQWELGRQLIEQGDVETGKAWQEEAHKWAEFARAQHGYSGGDAGTDFITPKEDYIDFYGYSDKGRQERRNADAVRDWATKYGEKETAENAKEYADNLHFDPSNLDYERALHERKMFMDKQERKFERENKEKGIIPVTQRVDAHGRNIYTPTGWDALRQDWFTSAVGNGIAGGFQTLLETAQKASQNVMKNRYDPVYQSKIITARNLEHRANATRDEEEKERLRATAKRLYEEAKAMKASDPVDFWSSGMMKLRQSQSDSKDLVASMETPAGRLLTKATLSMAQMAPFLAANVIPGAGQAVSLAGMGALAAGQKAGEIQMNGGSAQEALGRGLISGGIEALTEKVPLNNLLKIARGAGGTSFVKNVAKQAGIEATEESASYALNYLADKAAKDPNAKFSLQDLAESAAIGAISGGAFGAGGHFAGKVINGDTVTPEAQTNLLDRIKRKPTEEETTTTQSESDFIPNHEQNTQETENPLVRATKAKEQMQELADEVARANQNAKTEALTARERLAQAMEKWQERQDAQNDVANTENDTESSDFSTRRDNQTQQRRFNEIPETFDEYKSQFQDDIDNREMTEGQLLDEYNAIKRRNERLQRKGMLDSSEPVNAQDNAPGLRDSLGSARSGFDPYSQAMNRYGTIEPGENPARMVDVPRSMTGTDRVRKSARTFMEAKATSDELVDAFQEGVTQGEWSYTPKKDKDSVDRSMRVLSGENGIEKGLYQWDEVVNGNRQATKDDIVLAEMMYKMAAKNGDITTAKRLAAEIAALGTTAGQNVQAIRLLKKATPEGKLFYVQKSVDKINADIAKRIGNSDKVVNAKDGKQASRNSEFTDEEVKRAIKGLTESRDDAIRTIDSIISAFRKPQGESSWVSQLGEELAKNTASRASSKKQVDTIYKRVLSDLNRFMFNYVDKAQSVPTNKRTAAERLTDYFANKEEYTKAWEIAQDQIREKYKNPKTGKVPARFKDFLENGIDHDIVGRDAVVMDAVAQAALDSDVSINDAVIRHNFSDPKLYSEIAEKLIQDTGATGKDATMLRSATWRWAEQKATNSKKSANEILDTDIRKNMKELGVTVSDVLKTGAKSREELSSLLAKRINEQHGVSKEVSENVADQIVSQFNETIEQAANKKLTSMFKDKPKSVKKSLDQRVVEMAQLGAFSKSDFNELATSKLFGTEKIEVPDEMQQRLLESTSKEEEDAALDEIYDYVADRVPKTFGMRLDAWRYFAMLGNPRTHIRNVVGNVLMQGLTRTSNAGSAALQKAIIRDKEQRTRTFAASGEARKFAKQDFKENKDLLSGNPYTTSESGEIWQRVREKAFTVDANKRESSAFWKAVDGAMKVPQTLSELNSKGLDLEDMIFKKATYIDSLANFLTTRGYKSDFSNVPENVMEEARGHAINDALEATFQEYSALASKLAQFEQSSKKGKFLVGGMFPFKRVPINITKQGVRYSPAGLFNSITSGAKKLHNGDISAAKFCDDLSAGLTGTSVAALGAFLLSQGILSAGNDEDDKQSGFDAAMGSQEYAINFNVNGQKYSYTIDWGAPSVIPLFIGAEFYKALTEKDEETSLSKAALTSLGRMFESIFQMTMLSGISSTLKSAAYNKSNPAYGVLGNVASNYAGQVVPTLLGQIARTKDPIRRTTFYDANSKVPKEIQQFLQKQGAKIPGLSDKMPEYLDVWGRNDVGSDNMLLRALYNFTSPGYINKVNSSGVENELQRLTDAGYEKMLPTEIKKSDKLDNNRMTAEQWMTRQKTQGGTAYKILEGFMGTKEYNALTDDQKAKFVEKAFDYAKNAGKASAGGDTSGFAKWYEAANNAEKEAGLSKERFLSLYAYKSAIEDEAPDEAVAGLKQGMWEEYINGLSDLSQEQKDYVLDKVKFWQMSPASSMAYNKAKEAGYDTPEKIQDLLNTKKSFDTDGNNNINQAELYKGITSYTSDPAEQEKMYDALKASNATKSWKELATEQGDKAQAVSSAQATLDQVLSKDKQATLADAYANAEGTKQTDAYRALTSTGLSDADCKAYFAYISAENGWVKSWEKVKKDALKGK